MSKNSRFGEIFAELRNKEGISQEALAEKIGVSKQAIQKWESGKCFPEFENLSVIAEYWNVSIDYLITGVDRRSVEERRTDNHPLPSYKKIEIWEAYYRDLLTEYKQCFDEGKDVEEYKELMTAINRLQDGKLKASLADDVFYELENLPQRKGYRYVEPSDFDGIIDECEPMKYNYPKQDKATLLEKIKGAWYGRICGCLLGKPIEGIMCDELNSLLKASGNYPLNRYITRSDVEKALDITYSFPIKERVIEDGVLDGMPADDDTNYIMISLLHIKKFGRNFTPENVARNWLALQPKNAYCTAERVAFHNFINGYLPPLSATYQNPYREWIGAQIRGDFFGWINPANPALAAEYAWRDASISHVKNGIYGEMWVSAMLAAVCGGADIKTGILVGASYVPKKSRLYEAIQNVVAAYESGISSSEFFKSFHTRWDEHDNYDWCHTVSNAEIVTAALLWGGGDYEKSICLAVQEGFDTDCNGATVGSVVGAAIGNSEIPEKWKSKINGTLFTTIFGYWKVSVDEMAEKTLSMIE